VNIYKLGQQIVSKDAEERKKAIETLAPVPDVWALHTLKLATENEKGDLQQLALNACKLCESNLVRRILKYIPGLKKGSENINKTITEALHSEDVKVQLAAIRSIAMSRNVILIDTISSISSKSKSLPVIIECLKCLGFMGQKKEAFFITGFTTNPEQHVRSAALVALSMINKSLTWSIIIEIASSTSSHLAPEAIAILHGLRDEKLEKIFSFMLHSQSALKAEAAIKIIAKLGESEHLKLLGPIVTGKDIEKRNKAITVLKILEKNRIQSAIDLLSLTCKPKDSCHTSFEASDSGPLPEESEVNIFIPRSADNGNTIKRDTQALTVPDTVTVPDTFMNGLSVLQNEGPQAIADSAEHGIDCSWAAIKSSLGGDELSIDNSAYDLSGEATLKDSETNLSAAFKLETADSGFITNQDTNSALIGRIDEPPRPNSNSEDIPSENDLPMEVEQARKAILSQSITAPAIKRIKEGIKESRKGNGRQKIGALFSLLAGSLIYLIPVAVFSGCFFVLHLASRRDLLSEPIWTIPPLLIMILVTWIYIPNRTDRDFCWISKRNCNENLYRAMQSVATKTLSDIPIDIAITSTADFCVKKVSSLPLLPLSAGKIIQIGGLALPQLSVRELKVIVATEMLFDKQNNDVFQQYLITFLDDLTWIEKCYGRNGKSLNPLCWYASFIRSIILKIIGDSWLSQRNESDIGCAQLYGSNIFAKTLTAVSIIKAAIDNLGSSKLVSMTSKPSELFHSLNEYLNTFILKRGEKTKEKLLTMTSSTSFFAPNLARRLASVVNEKAERTRIIKPATSLLSNPEGVSEDLAMLIKTLNKVPQSA
jgi:hypothetical protein